MSLGGRIILAVACFLIAVAFAVLGAFYGDFFPQGGGTFYGLAAFCFLISLACMVSASRPIALRLIAAVVFVCFALYVFDTFGKPNFWRALAGFVVFGLPAGYVVLQGKYPGWGRAAEAFGVSPSREENRREQDTSTE